MVNVCLVTIINVYAGMLVRCIYTSIKMMETRQGLESNPVPVADAGFRKGGFRAWPPKAV